MPANMVSIQKTARSHLSALRGWFPLFPIWALQWIASALIDYAGDWRFPPFTQQAVLLAAVLLSTALLLFRAPNPAASDSAGRRSPSIGLKTAAWMSVPFFIGAGSAFLLFYTHAIDPFFAGLFRTLTLSFLYVLLGVFIGRELVFLGLWLFTLCFVTSIWYLGFTPIVLDLMGGFSLAACGWMLSRWSKVASATDTSGQTQ